MKHYKVMMTKPAAEDLQQIAHYIAIELREPVSAQRLVDRIKDQVMSLAEMPTRHELVADGSLASQGIRRLVIDNYIVFYIIAEKERTVTIIRILYGRRNWEQLL